MFSPIHEKGLSVVELMLVIAIVGILGGISTPILSNYYVRYQNISAEDRLVGALRKAQIFSMQHRLGVAWGVCVTGSTLRMFGGSCGAATVAEDWQIPAGVGITGLTSLSFGAYRGEPNSAATVTLTANTGVTTVVVNSRGGIDVN